MEFIQNYDSGSERDDDGAKNSEQQCTSGFVDEGLSSKAVRQVYLITYSQAELQKFPTRLSFARAVLYSFSETPATVRYWSCSRERHHNSGFHYHMAIKLDRNQRWIMCKRSLERRHDISVHFSNVHHNYFSAWRYVGKCDESVLESDGHPDLRNSSPPRTTGASMATKPARRTHETSDSESEFAADCPEEQSGDTSNPPRRANRAAKKKRMSAFELSEIIVEKGIKTRTELLALANDQRMAGKTDIAEFIVNRGSRVVAEVLETAWEMVAANDTLRRAEKSRLQLLEEAKESPCSPGCDGLWLRCAKQVLERNGVARNSFSTSVRDLLEKGRGKYRNMMIVGPANCGKTFLLNPLNVIYSTFCNPACTSFAWVGAEKAECIFLNDFRWSPQIIQWHDFLLMLEGQTVHLPAPKTHYARDIVFDSDTPIFCTGKHSIIYIKNGVVDERETEMMSVRWKIFNFNFQIPQAEQREVPSCPKCFARLILDEGDD